MTRRRWRTRAATGRSPPQLDQRGDSLRPAGPTERSEGSAFVREVTRNPEGGGSLFPEILWTEGTAQKYGGKSPNTNITHQNVSRRSSAKGSRRVQIASMLRASSISTLVPRLASPMNHHFLCRRFHLLICQPSVFNDGIWGLE